MTALIILLIAIVAVWGGEVGLGVALETVCTLDGTQLTDHLWVQNARPFQQGGFQKGDRVQFTARVRAYSKRRDGRWVTDYGIEVPTRLQRV